MEKDSSQMKTVGDLVRAQYEAEKKLQKTFKSVEPLISKLEKIKFPTFDLLEKSIMENHILPDMPTLKDYTPPEVTRERNAWERHTEALEVQNAVLEVQKEILTEQRNNKIFVIVGLIFSGCAALFGAIAIYPILTNVI